MYCVLSPLSSPGPDAEVQLGAELNESVKCGRYRVGNQFVLNIVCKTMKEGVAECSSVPVTLTGLGPEVNGEVCHWLPWHMESRSQAASEPAAPSPMTLHSSSEKAWNDAQAGVRLSHYAVPQRRALPVRLLMTYATLAFSVANVYGCRLKSKEQEVRKGRQSLGSPSSRAELEQEVQV